MPKCVCGREIEEWEVVCFSCWSILTRYDEKFGTDFRNSIVKAFNETGQRNAVDEQMMKAFEERLKSDTMKKVEKLKSKMKKICNACELENHPEIDECFQCPIHILFNKMLEELLNGK